MKYHHVRLHPDEAMPLLMGQMDRVSLPMVPQPTGFDGSWLDFGDQVKVAVEDYPCPHGSVGHGILFYLEGNVDVFFHARVREIQIVRASAVDLPEYWQNLYGDSVCDSRFDPFLWQIRFSK